ncbi:MAG TPA: hypothetical protein PKH23_01105 [Bacillota bacterium]|nr:hypothetical protein [Bacillota bacterium]
MKKCEFCGIEVPDDAAFCGNCGKPQAMGDIAQISQALPQEQDTAGIEPKTESTPVFSDQVTPLSPAAPEQPVMPPAPPASPLDTAPGTLVPPPQVPQGTQAPPQGYAPAGYYPPAQPSAPGVPPAPKPPSKLALEAKGYFPWLTKGFLGTTEPMSILLAAIVPFLVAFFFTLGNASGMSWHAGAFFLTWLMNMVFIGVLPVAVWFVKKYWEKDEASTLEAVFAEYSSYHNVALPVVFFAMIFGIAFPVFYSSVHFISALFQFVRLVSLGASLACLFSPRDAVSKSWLKVLTVIGVFVVLWFIVGACYNAGFRWGFRW